MVSSSALAVPSIPLPPPGAYKRTRPSPVFITPAPAKLLRLPPERNKLALPCFPRRFGEPLSPFLVILSPIKPCSKLRHTLTVTGHSFPPPIMPGNRTGDITVVDTRHRAVDRSP
jgi:hypothetical protein